jgi:hypothetical protein
MKGGFMDILGYFGMVMAMIGTYINAKGNRYCFAIWAISNGIFIGISIATSAWPQVGLFSFNLAMCLKGWRCWNAK